MRHALFLLLTACSGDTFTIVFAEGGLPDGDSSSESSTDADSGKDPVDSGGLDAREVGEDSSTLDAKADGPCPTGTAACDDAIVDYCARLKVCCNGQCQYAWANTGGAQCIAQFSTGGCSGKMICETQCLSDLQSANCTAIKQGPSPPYVASSCMSLWQ
jgi:hypothetical protein